MKINVDPDTDPAYPFDADADPNRIQIITLMWNRILPFNLKRIHPDRLHN
jgi:hypothetical protein